MLDGFSESDDEDEVMDAIADAVGLTLSADSILALCDRMRL